MFLNEVTRETGYIGNLDDMIAILDDMLPPDRDKKSGKHILPTCILIAKMFSMQVVCGFKGKDIRYFLRYKGKFYDFELMIESKSEKLGDNVYRNRLEYAEIGLRAYLPVRIGEALSNGGVCEAYEEIIDGILDCLKEQSEGTDFSDYDDEERYRGVDRDEYDGYDGYDGYDNREVIDLYEGEDGEIHAVYGSGSYSDYDGDNYDDLDSDYFEADEPEYYWD